MTRRVFWVSLALASLASLAAADTGFVWEAPASCPDATEVRARIARRLGRPVDGTVHGIEVAIDRAATGFVARIDTRGVTVANQVRTLTSARCDALADAVAVIVARLASEAFARAAGERHANRVAAIVDDEPAQPAVWLRPSEAAPASSIQPDRPVGGSPWRDAGKWGGGARALALSGIGTLPGIGIGGDLGGFVRRHDTFVEAAVTRWVSSPRYLVAGAPGRVEVQLDSFAVRGGWSPQLMPIRAWLGVELGTITGQGVGLTDPQRHATPWIAGTTGFGVAWPMARRARLVGTFEVAVPLRQMSFNLADGQQIYRPSPVAARCALGLELGWR